MYELTPVNPAHRVKGGVYGRGRILIGRSESCDMSVNHEAVSAIHAVLEIFDERAVIYDMNSTNGTYVNGEKVVAKELRLGDIFSLANADFRFNRYVASSAIPPVLDTLEPEHGEASVRLPDVLPDLPKSLPNAAPKVSQHSPPSIVYPLAADPKAEFSEYIFEDRETIYPIFKYETTKQSVEVIILFKDSIFSVDYLPEGNFTYHITGILKDSKELEFPYLGKNDKFPFVDVSSHSAVVHTIPGFGVFHLSDKKKDTGHVGGSIELSGQDLVRFAKDDLQIFVRHVAAPPKVASAPIMKRDPDFQKYMALMLFALSALFISLNVVELPEVEKDELAPEKLATILYRQTLTVAKNKAVEKTENAPKIAQKAPSKPAVQKEIPVEKQPDVQKPDLVETKDQSKKPDPGKVTATEKKIVKQGTTPVTTPTDKMASPPKAAANNSKMPTANAPTAMSQVTMKTVGHVEVYKSADFSTSINTIVARGGSLSGVQTKGVSGSGGAFTGAATGVSTGTGNIKSAEMVTSQGSLVGATTGQLGESKGAEGLSSKRAIYTAGIPSETVVLGSMDPDVIRRILLDHLPQFRYCYQKELERTGAETSGTIKLDFTIGASGHVSQAGVEGASNLPVDVKKCVVSVLKGIAFPEPMGGGTVEVKQPMNFYPKKI